MMDESAKIDKHLADAWCLTFYAEVDWPLKTAGSL